MVGAGVIAVLVQPHSSSKYVYVEDGPPVQLDVVVVVL